LPLKSINTQRLLRPPICWR